MFFEQYSCQTCRTLFSGGPDRQELFVPLLVTSTPLETLSLQLFESQNKNFILF